MYSNSIIRQFIRTLLMERTPAVVVPSSFPLPDDQQAEIAALKEAIRLEKSSPEVALYNSIEDISTEVNKQLKITSTRNAIDTVEDVNSLVTGIVEMLNLDANDPKELGWPYRTALFLSSWIHTEVNPTSTIIKNTYAVSNPLQYAILLSGNEVAKYLGIYNESFNHISKIRSKKGALLKEGMGQKIVNFTGTIAKHVFGGSYARDAATYLSRKSILKLHAKDFLTLINENDVSSLVKMGDELFKRLVNSEEDFHPIFSKDIKVIIQEIVEESFNTGVSVAELINDTDKLIILVSNKIQADTAAVKLFNLLQSKKFNKLTVPQRITGNRLSDSNIVDNATEISIIISKNDEIDKLIIARNKFISDLVKTSTSTYDKTLLKSIQSGYVVFTSAILGGAVSGYFNAEYENKTLTKDTVISIILADSLREIGRDNVKIGQGSELSDILNSVNLFADLEDAFEALEALFDLENVTPDEMKGVKEIFENKVVIE